MAGRWNGTASTPPETTSVTNRSSAATSAVLFFGILLTVARQTANQAFGRLPRPGRWLLVAVGIYLIIRQWWG